MRVVYDDMMQKEFCHVLENVMLNLRLSVLPVIKYEYGMYRVQRSLIMERLNWVLEDYDMEIGKTVIHANGIGNNCEYPVYYNAKNEIQHCANIHINSGLYGDVYVYVTDYNNNRVTDTYKLTQHGVTFNYR